jgi:hypothetical protein
MGGRKKLHNFCIFKENEAHMSFILTQKQNIQNFNFTCYVYV